jgi:hypothetical protein
MASHRPNAATYPCKVTGKRIEGAAGLPSRARRVSRTGVGGAASRGWHRPRRTVPHSGGDGFPPRELVRQDRGASPRRMMAPHCYGQSIKCPYPRTGSGACTREGPIRRTREGGSEWEPIKILLEGDANSNKTNAVSNTRLRLTTKVGQAHVATGVPLDLGTNTQPSDPRNAAEKPNLESTDQHRSDR